MKDGDNISRNTKPEEPVELTPLEITLDIDTEPLTAKKVKDAILANKK